MEGDGFVLELVLVGFLILLNGFFAGAEIAIVTARRGRLQALVEKGDRRAAAALRLKADPDRFLATVQIGVTVVGTLASAVGGVAAIERFEPWLAALPWPWARAAAEPIAVGTVVFSIAYLSLLVGELVPKSIAVRNAESLALWLAPVIEALTRAGRPAVAVLTASSQLVLRLMRQKPSAEPPFHTLEDLRAIAEEVEEQGIVQNELVTGAVAFQEREVREVLTPRRHIRALPVDASLAEALRTVTECGHSRLPVFEESLDNILGFVYARDVYETALHGRPLELRAMVRNALIVPGTKAATELLADMRREGIQMSLVVDEHGSLLGLVTLEDLIEVIVGEIRDEHEEPEALVKDLGERGLEVDGAAPIHVLNGDHGLKLPESANYVTVAGLLLHRLGAIPRAGEVVPVPPYVLTVQKVDGQRVARVLVQQLAPDLVET